MRTGQGMSASRSRADSASSGPAEEIASAGSKGSGARGGASGMETTRGAAGGALGATGAGGGGAACEKSWFTFARSCCAKYAASPGSTGATGRALGRGGAAYFCCVRVRMSSSLRTSVGGASRRVAPTSSLASGGREGGSGGGAAEARAATAET